MDESAILLDWGPDQDIEQLPGVEDSDEEKDGKEMIHPVSFQRAKTPEVSAQESAMTEPGHHSETSKPAEKLQVLPSRQVYHPKKQNINKVISSF